MKLYGDAVAWCLIVLLSSWNAYLSLQIQRNNQVNHQSLADLVNKNMADIEESSMRSISMLIKDVTESTNRVVKELAVKTKAIPNCNIEATNQRVAELHDQIVNLQSSLTSIQLVVSGQENIEGLRTHYQRTAFDNVMKRIQPWHSGRFSTSMPVKKIYKEPVNLDHLTDNQKELYMKKRRSLLSVDEGKDVGIADFLLLLPTFKRPLLHDGTEYLRRALTGLAQQYNNNLAHRYSVHVLVVNNSPKTHTGVQETIAKIQQEENSSLQVYITDGNAEFEDPVSENYHVKVDLPGKNDVLESWTPSRKHCRHLAESFSKAVSHPAKYVMLWEDDMLFCGDSQNGTLKRLFDLTEEANRVNETWTGLRLGFGGNGLVLHWSDLPIVGDYLLANMHRRPPDWLLTEWYKGMTYTAKMAIGDRHSGFTNNQNMFEHIGAHSSFPGRENQGEKDSESHVDYDIPKCFDHNWWLLPEERPHHKCDNFGITPCTKLKLKSRS